MGYEKIDKTAEELQRQSNKEFLNEPSMLDNGMQTQLTNAENENLTGELSGEAQSLGFTRADSEALTSGLSGSENDNYYIETKNKQSFQQSKRAGDANNIGVPDYDIKISNYNALVEKFKTLSPENTEYYQVLSEIERQKLSLMNDNEQKNYITAKIWNAYNNKDSSALENILNDFYEYKYEELENKYKNSGMKKFFNEHKNIQKLVVYINTVLNESETKISKAELIWETVKSIADVIERLIIANGENPQENINSATISSVLHNSNSIIQGAVFAYLGIDLNGVEYNAKNNEFTEEENSSDEVITQDEIYHLKADFKNISAKEFRSKIRNLKTFQKLNIISELIEQSEYTKAEKQMLKKECEKQLGIMQSGMPDITQNEDANSVIHIQQNTEAERIRALIAYNMYNNCKYPTQRSITQLLLSDSKLYLADNSERIFIEILEQCKNKSDYNAKQKFIEKVLENPNLLNEFGVLSKNIMLCIRDVNANNSETVLSALENYKKNSSEHSVDDFSQILYDLIKESHSNSDNNGKIIANILDETTNTLPIMSVEISGKNMNEIKELQNAILVNENLNLKEDFILKDENNEYSYAEFLKTVFEKLVLKTQYKENNALVEFCSEILLNPELNRDVTSLKVLSMVLSSSDELDAGTESFYYESVYHTLKTCNKNYEDENKILSISEELRTVNYLEFLNKFTENGFKTPESNLITSVVFSVLEKRTQLFENFTIGRSYTNEMLYDLFKATQKTYCIDILSDLSKRKEFSAKDIIQVANLTTKNTVEITQQVLSKSDLTSNEKVEVLTSIQANRDQMDLIKLVLSKDELNLKVLPNILKSIKILDEHDAGGKHDRINLKKLNEYTALLQNPKTENWVIKMLNLGLDIETISHIEPNEAHLYYEEANGSFERIINENIKLFMELGMNKNEAIATVNAISENGIIVQKLKEAAIELLQAGTPKDLISEILNSAYMSGVYDSHITTDAMSILNMGLNAFAERFLPIVNNLSSEEIRTRFSPFLIKRLHGMIAQLPHEQITALSVKGFDINKMLKKLNIDISENISQNNYVMDNREYMDISELDEPEKNILDKYAPPQTMRKNKSAIRNWAEQKYLAIKNEEYLSVKNAKIDNVESERIKRLEMWFTYIETEPNIKNNPLAKLLLADFVTTNSLSEGSILPPEFDKKLAENIILNVSKSNPITENNVNISTNELPSILLEPDNNKRIPIKEKKQKYNI